MAARDTTEVDPGQMDPRIPAAVELIGRTGAEWIQLRYCDEEMPVLWMAVAAYKMPGAPRSGNPARRADTEVHKVGAGTHPLTAVLTLCESLVDGGVCTECGKPTAFIADHDDTGPLLDTFTCPRQWDPELQTFRRACEGD